MDFAVPQPRLEFEQLQRAYQNAWRLFCAEVHAWQSLSLDAANVTAMEAAKDVWVVPRDRTENSEINWRIT
jgi:hypothetical protein